MDKTRDKSKNEIKQWTKMDIHDYKANNYIGKRTIRASL